ncbi:MAG: hypothetical protein MUF42_07555 [Cytophagaceae bacterium]|jgi:hypothetical protein|nr:hypothetical protein [Cytophagaceae bacterium]
MIQDKEVKKNDRIGMITSIGIHALLLLIFMLTMAWSYPDPPPPSAPGLEIALGFEAEGKQVEEVIPTETTPQEITEEEVETDNTTESPDVVEPKEKKPEVKEVVPDKPKEEKPKEENLFKRPTKGDTQKEGDQGDPKNLMNKKNGTGNGSDGTSNGTIGNETTLNIDGWKFDNLSNQIDPTSKIGFVSFKFVIDEDGKIISITKVGGANLSPTEENFYKKQLLETTFIWKDDTTDPPSRTTGYFSRHIRSK